MNTVKFYTNKTRDGTMAAFTSVVTGVGLPIVLTAQSVLSFIGSGLVGRGIYKYGDDIKTIGVISEWPANGLGYAYMARYFNKWAITRQGDLVTAKQVIARRIEKYKKRNITLYKRLISVANDQLDHYAHGCMFTNLPTTYRFR